MPTVPFKPCMTCREQHTPHGVECKRCRAQRKRLYVARQLEVRDESDEYRAVKAVRVEAYAAIIATGGRLFEDAPCSTRA